VKGTTFERCTACRRKTNGADAKRRHGLSGCAATGRTWAFKVRTRGGAQELRAGFRTAAEAERELRDVLARLDSGSYVKRNVLTLVGFLVDEWIPATAERVAYSTCVKRTYHAKLVRTHLGDVPLQAVTGADLDRLYSKLLRDGGSEGRPLAASTVRDVHRTLHKAYRDAGRWQLVERNPCERAEPPRMSRVVDDARAAVAVWTPEQLVTFLEHSRGHYLGTLFHLAAATGMRRSELCGLSWDSVDLARAELRVRAKVVRSPEGYRVEASTKTAAGSRRVALDAGTLDVLRRYRAEQDRVRGLVGVRPLRDAELVFTSLEGGHVSPEAVSQAFRRLVRSSGLPPIRFHDLRHTHATLLLQAGEPVKVVSERLGHASAVVTLGVYAHVLPGAQEGAAERFGAMLAASAGESGSPVVALDASKSAKRPVGRYPRPDSNRRHHLESGR
jgi:integrase